MNPIANSIILEVEEGTKSIVTLVAASISEEYKIDFWVLQKNNLFFNKETSLFQRDPAEECLSASYEDLIEAYNKAFSKKVDASLLSPIISPV